MCATQSNMQFDILPVMTCRLYYAFLYELNLVFAVIKLKIFHILLYGFDVSHNDNHFENTLAILCLFI